MLKSLWICFIYIIYCGRLSLILYFTELRNIKIYKSSTTLNEKYFRNRDSDIPLYIYIVSKKLVKSSSCNAVYDYTYNNLCKTPFGSNYYVFKNHLFNILFKQTDMYVLFRVALFNCFSASVFL